MFRRPIRSRGGALRRSARAVRSSSPAERLVVDGSRPLGHAGDRELFARPVVPGLGERPRTRGICEQAVRAPRPRPASSPGSTSRPVSPSATTSGTALTRVATIGSGRASPRAGRCRSLPIGTCERTRRRARASRASRGDRAGARPRAPARRRACACRPRAARPEDREPRGRVLAAHLREGAEQRRMVALLDQAPHGERERRSRHAGGLRRHLRARRRRARRARSGRSRASPAASPPARGSGARRRRWRRAGGRRANARSTCLNRPSR